MSKDPRDLDRPVRPDRREFLRRLAAGAAYAAPVFATVGAWAAESAAYERARGYLAKAKTLVSRARKASSDEERHDYASEAAAEMTEAKKAVRSATSSERERFEKESEAVVKEIQKLLGEDRRRRRG